MSIGCPLCDLTIDSSYLFTETIECPKCTRKNKFVGRWATYLGRFGEMHKFRLGNPAVCPRCGTLSKFVSVRCEHIEQTDEGEESLKRLQSFFALAGRVAKR